MSYTIVYNPLIKTPIKYKVKNTESGRVYSKEYMTYSQALKQIKILFVFKYGYFEIIV